MADRCRVCHTGLMNDAKDFHVIMSAQAGLEPCQTCHTEHHGADAVLTNRQMVDFPHDQVGFSLKAHLKTIDGETFTCAGCHPNTFTKPDASLCIDCHSAYQAEKMQQHVKDFPGDCLGCHDGVDRYSDFNHSWFPFKLEGKHLEIQCSDCHKDAQTIADLQGLDWECSSCHADIDPHGDQFNDSCDTCHNAESWKPTTFDHDTSIFPLTGQHIELECNTCHNSADTAGVRQFIGLPTDCNSCHGKENPHVARFGQTCETCHTTAAWWPAEFDHNLAAFALVGKHVDTACEDCHTTIREDGRPVFKGTPADCFSCHKKDDEHNGNLGTSCADCHTPADWKPSTFDHNKSSFLLTGKHGKVACNDCHTQTDGTGHRIYRGTPRDCFSCHKADDAHKGEFGPDCLSCHTTNAWKPSTFDHSRTAFQLTGAHASSACKSCHASQWKGTPTACISCHSKDDAHKGQFGNDCKSCHSTSAWKPSTFDHSRAAFKLTGAHVNTACKSCHTSGWKGTPSACVSCHSKNDAHNGQFGTDCQSCHSTSAWKPATFDHSRSSFKLTGAHVNTACKSCHTSGWKGTPSACASCHRDQHGGQFGSNCSSCHSTNAWKPASYNGPHSFPMGHGNANGCASCHPNGLSSWTCYTCHNQNETIKHHNEKNLGDISNCLRCHPDGRKNEGGGD